MGRMNPAELEIALFCLGARLDPTLREEAAGRLRRTRAGLGSGLEAVIPAAPRDIRVNIPVAEPFAEGSPLLLARREGETALLDERDGERYAVRLPDPPAWYDRRTRRGTPMGRVGTLQGKCLSFYVGRRCDFWAGDASDRCAFCTTGLNVGVAEDADKDVEDVVETALAAKRESGVSFVHLNSGFHENAGVEVVEPYVRAIKRRVGAMVGVQCAPDADFSGYDRLIRLGVEHFSFCFELYGAERFAALLPGKARRLGRERFFDALAYCARRTGSGRCSGEIVAGLEPVADTMRAIDAVTALGAFPTVCVFRPLQGARLEAAPPPRYEDMVRVFLHVAEACRRDRIPVGLAPNVEPSLFVLPTEALLLAPDTRAFRRYRRRLRVLTRLARPYFALRTRARGGA